MYQLKALIGMVVRPKATLIDLPLDRFLITSLIVAGYFGFARVTRGGQFRELADLLDSSAAAAALLVVAGFFGFVVGAFILKLIVRVFGKRLTLRKVMNIEGYAQVPRFVVAVPLSVALALAPDECRFRLLYLGEYKALTITVAVIGGLLLLYTLFLLIFGLVVSPGVPRTQRAPAAPE